MLWKDKLLFILSRSRSTTTINGEYARHYNYVARREERNEFRWFSYVIPNQGGHLTPIHYKGDDSNVEHDPHVRTCPSVWSKTKYLCPLLYHNIAVLLPRNTNQVGNIQALQRQTIRLTHDALYNLHELAYDIPDFVLKITRALKCKPSALVS